MQIRIARARTLGLASCKLVGVALAMMPALLGCAAAEPKPDAAPAPSAHTDAAPRLSSSEAKQRLVDGNARFASGKAERPRQTPDRRTEVAQGQRPFAVVIACADSRVAPETLFDQGLGDLFVVRVAGNVVDDHALGSVEYAVEHLHAGTIVVLGHERCGAVAAARDTIASGGRAEGHIQSLVDAIRPAVVATPGSDAETTCKTNVQHVVATLRESPPILRRLNASGEIKALGAYYDLDTGIVTFLNQP